MLTPQDEPIFMLEINVQRLRRRVVTRANRIQLDSFAFAALCSVLQLICGSRFDIFTRTLIPRGQVKLYRLSQMSAVQRSPAHIMKQQPQGIHVITNASAVNHVSRFELYV